MVRIHSSETARGFLKFISSPGHSACGLCSNLKIMCTNSGAESFEYSFREHLYLIHPVDIPHVVSCQANHMWRALCPFSEDITGIRPRISWALTAWAATESPLQWAPEKEHPRHREESKTIHSRARGQQSQLTPRTSWEKSEAARILAPWSQVKGVLLLVITISFYPRLGKCSSNRSYSFQSTFTHIWVSR